MSHIFLTGPPGIGKTTLVKNICDCLKKHGIPISGFYTEELRENGQRIGFDIVTLDGMRSSLARSSSKVRGPMVGKYTVNVLSFESSVLPLLEFQDSKKGILVVDEIGKMELFSDKFKTAIGKILHGKNIITVLGTIPIKRGNGIPFVERIKESSNVKVFDIGRENRNNISDEIVRSIIGCYEKK